jgi:hypothetical protein
MAKKHNRGRQQKRNVDPRKQEQFREEVAREPGVEVPRKSEKSSPRGNTPSYREKDR